MGLNNYLMTSEVQSDGTTIDIDIAFSYGEVREYFYRVGDKIFSVERDDNDLSGICIVVPGLAAIRHTKESGNTCERYYRIVLIDDQIVSYSPTTKDDYDALEGQI